MIKFKEFLQEMVGSYAIVGCEENPNFQTWGAKSDLNCKNKKDKKNKFKNWIINKKQGKK
jgi:hypothetical protein